MYILLHTMSIRSCGMCRCILCEHCIGNNVWIRNWHTYIRFYSLNGITLVCLKSLYSYTYSYKRILGQLYGSVAEIRVVYTGGKLYRRLQNNSIQLVYRYVDTVDFGLHFRTLYPFGDSLLFYFGLVNTSALSTVQCLLIKGTVIVYAYL